jgi:hypothetical protein
MKEPTSRWLRSEVTFGPVGRVTWTILLFLPLLFAIFYNFFFIVAAAIWMAIVPMGLRDVWRRVKRPGYETMPELPAPKGLQPGESLHDRTPPQRW